MPYYLKALILLVLLIVAKSSYLQLPLIRTPQVSKTYSFAPIKCKNESTLNQDAQYKQICYQKDITYSIPFIKDGMHYSLSADFTTPISWVKGTNCIVEGTNHKCTRLIETFIQKFKQTNSNKHNSRLKNIIKPKPVQNAIIEGSSEIIRGQIQKSKSISFIVKDSSRLNSFFQLIMLGLYIYGQKDTLALVNTNFVNALYLSPNLNALSDGALSLRFDQTAQTSFLQQIFTYVQSIQNSVTIFLGQNSTITIGDLTAKYTKYGYSSIHWIKMPEDEGFGRLPRIIGIGIDDLSEDREDDTSEDISAVFTLSASYISLPEYIITNIFIDGFQKEAVCKVNANSYIECSSSSKKKLQKIIDKNLVLKFQGSNMIIPMSKLVLKADQGKRAIFNIKTSYNNKAVLGQPVFMHYYFALDYLRNRIGFGEKRQNFEQFFIQVVTLVRFLCFVMLIGCGFVCCFQPCNKLLKKFKKSKRAFQNKNQLSKKKASQYSPVSENKSEQFDISFADTIQSPQEPS